MDLPIQQRYLSAYSVSFEKRFQGKLTAELEGAQSSNSSWEKDDIVPVGSALSATTRHTPKHRRRKVHLATRRNKRTQPSLPTNPSRNPPRHKKESYTLPSVDDVNEISILTIRYIWDVSSRAAYLSRYMLGFLLALWIVALIILQVSPTVWGAISPVCYLPLISSSDLCKTWRNAIPPQWADYPKMVDLQSLKTFEQLLGESIGRSALSLEVKKAEITISDLISIVRVSNLKAKDSLANSLTDFVLDAKNAGRGLQKLSSKIGGTVNRY